MGMQGSERTDDSRLEPTTNSRLFQLLIALIQEMYVVRSGRLEVLDGKWKVLSFLDEGQIFGELSVLRIPGNKSQNRRTATIRSVGFSELYRLRKNDLWGAILEYPNAKEKLIAKGQSYTRVFLLSSLCSLPL